MTSPCKNVELFVDGELSPEAAESFRQHLPDCAACQREVTLLLQLDVLGRFHLAQAETSTSTARTRPSLFMRWRRPVLLVAASCAAALLVLVTIRLQVPSPPHQDEWLARRPMRLLEARVSHAGADHYRERAAQPMGNGVSSGELTNEEAHHLEKEDPHGLVAAYLEQGEPDRALRKLDQLGHSPDLDSDRAVVMLLKHEPEAALRWTDGVLVENPRHPQALWNRGLALSQLNLPLVAARAFKEVASLKEPGWANEAARRAADLERDAFENQQRWEAIRKAGEVLMNEGPASLPKGFSQAPMARLFFYDAVRTAPTLEHVRALLPLARELDAQAGGHVLEEHILRIEKADFSRRAPLARDYAALVRRRLPEARKDSFLKALLASKEDDILVGALYQLLQVDAGSGLLERFEAKTANSDDPWFRMLAAQERAKHERKAGQWLRAAQSLLDAYRPCPAAGLEFRCLSLERELSGLFLQSHQLDDARTYAERGWQHARESNEWALERDMLWNLAQLARFVNDASLARARYGEIFEREPKNADMVRRFHQNLADIAWHELQVDEARREMDAALATGLPIGSSGAYSLSDIARLKSAPGDEAHLTQAQENAPRDQGAGEHAVLTHSLGRFFIERDVARGRAYLWRAIEEAEAPAAKGDPVAQRARAYSFTSLLFEAGKRDGWGEALELTAREYGQELPHQCLLIATVDSERTLLIVRGSSGELFGHHDEARRKPLPERLDGLVPESLLAPLRECARVEVLARPPLHGRAGLLPLDLAWSYLTRTGPSPVPRRTGPSVHLVVSEVQLLPNSPHARLNRWTPSFGPGEKQVRLFGAEATPSKVVAAMGDADEIDLVTHGFIHPQSDESYLQLAPEQDGSELKVSRVRSTTLRGSPFVVLAACYAAHTAYAVHEKLSLPAAFIKAGARGVLAATVWIPDKEAADFFNALRERMRRGEHPATALRDERMKWLNEERGAQWLDSVLLFE